MINAYPETLSSQHVTLLTSICIIIIIKLYYPKQTVIVRRGVTHKLGYGILGVKKGGIWEIGSWDMRY